MVTPGVPVVSCIFAAENTVGEKVLEEIAHPTIPPSRHKRNFGEWREERDGSFICKGTILVNNGSLVPLLLKRGKEVEKSPQTIIIQEVPGWNRFSLKPASNGDGVFILKAGGDLCGKQVINFATQVVALFVVHGFGWRNRRGEFFKEPYGEMGNPFTKIKRKEKKEKKRMMWWADIQNEDTYPDW